MPGPHIENLIIKKKYSIKRTQIDKIYISSGWFSIAFILKYLKSAARLH